MFRWILVPMMVVMGWGVVADASPTDVPRLLLVGDSWPAFMQLFRCFDNAFPEYPGLSGFGQRGHRTTLVGVRASEFDTPAFLDVVRDELLTYPTIDVVHLSLGGNDFVMDSHWSPSMPPEELQAFIDATNAHIASVIDFILAVRPNIRIGLCGYDYGNHAMGGATPLQMNTVWAQYEQTKLALAQSKPRVFYVHNLGLMQYHYGIPLAMPPVSPHSVPMPGGYAQNYLPFPGGDPNYNTPLEALIDDDLHLTMQGYDFLTRRCIEEFYATWISWPAVIEVLPLAKDAKSPQSMFRVTFSEPVTGVDAVDFAVSGSKAPGVVSVAGSGAVYTVTVDMNGTPGSPHLTVLDDDSIADGSANPLGGAGAGNGGFDHNGPLAYVDVPLAGPDDFDGAFRNLSDTFTPVAWMLGGQSFDPGHCDANGGSISVDPPGIEGNTMLDSYEVGLIYACLHNDSLNLGATGGVSHAMVEAAWLQNYSQMQSDLGGPHGRIVNAIPGLDSLLASFMTLGDSGSAMVPVLLMTAVSVLIDLPPDVQTPIPSNYVMLGSYLGPNGDADGDGFTNRQEYEFFVPLGGRDLYIAAALSPTMAPEAQCTNFAGGSFNEGDAFCISVPDPVNLGGGFEWLKDGVALIDDTFVAGSHWRELHINPLRRSDAGVYECVYDNGTQVFGPITVNIQPLPLLAPGSLAALVLIVAAAGLGLITRRTLPQRG